MKIHTHIHMYVCVRENDWEYQSAEVTHSQAWRWWECCWSWSSSLWRKWRWSCKSTSTLNVSSLLCCSCGGVPWWIIVSSSSRINCLGAETILLVLALILLGPLEASEEVREHVLPFDCCVVCECCGSFKSFLSIQIPTRMVWDPLVVVETHPHLLDLEGVSEGEVVVAEALALVVVEVSCNKTRKKLTVAQSATHDPPSTPGSRTSMERSCALDESGSCYPLLSWLSVLRKRVNCSTFVRKYWGLWWSPTGERIVKRPEVIQVASVIPLNNYRLLSQNRMLLP